jgi:hypothetical protein
MPQVKIDLFSWWRNIDAYWTMENTTKKSIKFPVVPDGCIDIVWKNGEIFLVGIMEIAMLVIIEPNDKYVGIRFRLGVIASLLHKDISEFNDQMVPLAEISPLLSQSLQTILDKTQCLFERLDKVFKILFEKVSIEQRILDVMEQIRDSSGNIVIRELSKKVSLVSNNWNAFLSSLLD